MAEMSNPLMSLLGQKMKKNRRKFWLENDYVVRESMRRNQEVRSIFFQSKGCRHDLAGGCSMCDYSAGEEQDETTTIEIVQKALLSIQEDVKQVLISPSGSMFDNWEVSQNIRNAIARFMSKLSVEHVSCETRAETLTASKVKAWQDILHEKELNIYMGLESVDPWVSRYSINKNMDLEAFQKAVKTLHGFSVQATANILLGAPFLSQADAIADTVRTITWAVSENIDEVCLFPVHVKEWTQIKWLYENRLYHPPSLWCLIEVLRRLPRDIVEDKVELAWITSMGAFNVIASPSTCGKCQTKVVERLEKFSVSNQYHFLEELFALECDCKNVWQDRLSKGNGMENTLNRAVHAYNLIGENEFSEWWASNNQRVLKAMHRYVDKSGVEV